MGKPMKVPEWGLGLSETGDESNLTQVLQAKARSIELFDVPGGTPIGTT
jgi:hypothetical protein